MSGGDLDGFEDLGAKRLATPLDLHRVATIGDAVTSRDGKLVAFVRGSLSDEATLKKVRCICVAPSDGSAHVRQLTSGADDSSPTWAADSLTLAFIRNGAVWTIRVDGGEAVQLTNFAIDVANLCWSPKGDALCFTAAVGLDDASFTETRERESQAVKWRVFDELQVRQWDRYVDQRRSHVFVVPLERDASTLAYRMAAPPRDLMAGVDADCPTNAFGGRELICFSPDGARVAFACKYRTIDAAWSVSTVIHVASLAGDDVDAAQCASHAFLSALTLESQAIDTCPAFSPDGSHLAWLSSQRPGNEADKLELMLHRVGSTTAQRVSFGAALDVSIGEYVWLTNRQIAFAADYRAHRALFVVDDVFAAAPVGARLVHGDGSVSGLAHAGGHKVVACHSSFTAPPELVCVDVGVPAPAARLVPLTKLNAALAASLDLAVPRSLSVVGHNGTPIQVWLVVPPRTALRRRAERAGGGKKMPVLLLAHGGPQGCWNSDWHSRWNVQVWAAAGLVCVVPNFTGSTGFGQPFVDAISGAWDVAAKDCLLALDSVLEQFDDFCDASQQFVMGASFGGWMALYLNGNSDNRFKASVAHSGIFDAKTMYYQTDELFFVENEWGRPGGADDSKFRLFSPSSFVERWSTPVLLTHGAKDYRCPLGESLAAFQAARRRGLKARLCINDDANHWVLNAQAAVQWHAVVRDWLAEFSEDVLEWK